LLAGNGRKQRANSLTQHPPVSERMKREIAKWIRIIRRRASEE